MFERQGNGRIYAHWRRDEACTDRPLDSGTGRRTATRLRVSSARSRDVEPSDQTSVSNEGENRVKELRMPNSALVGVPQRTAENGVETRVCSPQNGGHRHLRIEPPELPLS